MRQMQQSPAASSGEKRLALKARVHELLSGSDVDLSKDQIAAKLSRPGGEELRTAFYQMLREKRSSSRRKKSTGSRRWTERSAT